MIPEREREALMRLTMCARGECPMCKYEEQCDNWDFRMELATKNMNILADALRMTEPQTERSDMSEIDKMIKMVDGILGDDDLCEGCDDVIEGLSCAECRRKYADKIIKILRDVKHKPQTERIK